MRPLASALLSLCLASLALGQDSQPAEAVALPTRVSVAANSDVDGAAESPNTLQYFLWERLNKFGFRVDAANPVGHGKLDGFIAKRAAAWAEKDPGEAEDAGQLVSFSIEGKAACEYDSAEFFGQGQAHNYKGKVEVTLTDVATGETLATIELTHSWGRLPTNYTKRKTLEEYNTMLFGAVFIGLFKNQALLDAVPESKRAKLDAFLAELRARVVAPLEESMQDCDVYRMAAEADDDDDDDDDDDGDDDDDDDDDGDGDDDDDD